METQIVPGAVQRRIFLRDMVPGDNPRPIDEAFVLELSESIKAQGLLQKPLLRPLPSGKYSIVAGEHRIRACTLVYGADAAIDVDVKDLDDAGAEAAAATENILRLAMTPLQEAEAAAKALQRANNDRAEAARLLGWAPDTLSKRLGLMNACQEVRDALRKGAIKLGHAELLATMRKEAQVKTLALMLQREPRLSVNDLKQLLEKTALVLDTAIFDKKDCGACQHNSSNQSVLFAEAIAGGKCTNKACFEDKTEAELNARTEALKDDFQVVRIVRPGENFTTTALVADGPKGVGEQQAQACRTCKSFGAVVSAVPDKLGNVYKNMCMDVVCNLRMVAAAHAAPASTPASVEKPKSGGSAAAASNAKAAGTKTADDKPASSEPTQRVKDYREKLWRAIYKKVVTGLDVPKNRAVLVALCVTCPSVIDHTSLAETLPKGVDVDRTKPGRMVKKILELDKEELGGLVQRIAANVSSGMHALELRDVTDILKTFDVKVADHWKISKPFLELLTKNEIDAVADEIGLKKHMGAKYSKARNSGKPEFIDALLDSKFEFEGKIPKVMDLASAPR